jgi:hypothetical protein
LKKKRLEWFGTAAGLWLLLVVALTIGIRLRLLDMPLERDEGEYGYAGQLLLEGVPPYQLAYNMKMPGTYLAYAVLMLVFGANPTGVHAGLLLVHLLTLGLLGAIARKFCSTWGVVAAVTTFALMTLSPSCLGLMAHATHFVLLPALAGCLILLRAESKNPWADWWSGFCFGLAFLMKQPGLFFGLGAGLYLGIQEIRRQPKNFALSLRRLICFVMGGVLPLLLVGLGLAWAGVFGPFWFWTVVYAREYASLISWTDGGLLLINQVGEMVRAAPLLWLGALIGFVRVGIGGMRTKDRWVLGGFLLFSFLAVCPGFYFRPHYFILLGPALGLLMGLAVSWGEEKLIRAKPSFVWAGALILAVIVACLQSLVADRSIYFSLSSLAASRAIYGINPFPESQLIAAYLKEHTTPEQRILVMGSEPQIYFYAQRHSSTGYIYTYSLMEPQPFARTMQNRMIEEIEKNPPAYVVFVNIPTSWLVRPTSDLHLLKWFDEYRKIQMEAIGLIQLIGPDQVETQWGPEVEQTVLRSTYYVAIFKRKIR